MCGKLFSKTMKKFKSTTIVFIIIILFLLTSCKQEQNLINTQTDEATIATGYPPIITENNIAEGYPTSKYEPAIATGFTPNSSLGIVYGRILKNGEPVVGYNVYLADLLVNDQGQERVASLKISSAPQATLDINGDFVFNEVKPDRYALMFSTGTGSYLLLVPNQEPEEAIIVEVESGKSKNIGTLDYMDLPIN